jgi:hypothetical protein
MRTRGTFHDLFYGLRKFRCKSVQLRATRRKFSLPLVSSEKDAAQNPEKLRKSLSLNYKSAALTN